ncbi:MAG: glucose-1-phosphate thymidylyltransferase RfbA [Candidatus Gastranaerophilales bacterium]|nr:glucose-1-phosphate thymidylyltransferase RfbA [Candidatus Gastranaerophilales bacterium]
MKGIILAGGAGTRLYPASIPISKILLPVYDKPMVYYPLSTLMQAGIKDILIISNPDDVLNFERLLGNGSQLGINIQYEIQPHPKGIAEAFIIAEKFIGEDSVALILGDNIFHGQNFEEQLKSAVKNNQGATVFGYTVKNPGQFGVVEFDKNMNVVSIEEKPQNPKSHYAVVGLYFYNNEVVKIAKSLNPSARGELEITDLNNVYLKNHNLKIEILGRGFAWLDTGTHDTLLQASNFIQSMELTKGEKIGCLEETAISEGFITKAELLKRINPNYKNEYLDYIKNLPE